MSFRIYLPAVAMVAMFGLSCGGGGETPTQDMEGQNEESPQSSLLEIEGKVFSFPSPVQTAILIKDVGSTYNASLLNKAASYTQYSTGFKKAINLGIYGADLGYVTIYEQTQDAISYLKAVKSLANDLGVSGAFDMKLLERFEKNIGNKDSMLALVADAFRASDAYLKNNERSDVGALVLAGGWVESLYFSTMVADVTKNAEVITRIGAQKNSCKNLVQLLMPHYNKEEYTMFIDQLMELNDVFSGIEIAYQYKEPKVDAAKKTTKINSITDIKVSDGQLKDISGKIKKIRENLIS